MAFGLFSEAELEAFKPKFVYVNSQNQIVRLHDHIQEKTKVGL
jgi:aspartate 1-decarboxylase